MTPMSTRPHRIVLIALAAILLQAVSAEDPPHDNKALAPTIENGWSWVHEEVGAWKFDPGGLAIRALPGTLWGSKNDGLNQLVRPAPEGGLAVEVTVRMDSENPPRWEQAGLLWYVDDDNFVKLVKEDEHEKWNIVMGTEKNAATTVLCVTPVAAGELRLRLERRGDKIVGRYRVGEGDWQDAAECEFASEAKAHIGLHAQRGPADREHWIRFSDFRVLPLPPGG